MPTRRQLIQKIELNSDQSSVTFSGIPQNYTDLKLEISYRHTTTGTAQSTVGRMNINGVSTNRDYRVLYASSGTSVASYVAVAGGYTGNEIGSIPGTSVTSGTFASTTVYIPSYTSSTYKPYSVRNVTENNSSTNNYIFNAAGLWSSTSAINELSIFSGAGNLAAGSSFYLYGITHVPIIRGGEEYVLNGFKYHKFTSTAALQVIEPGNVEYLVVAGGGSGGGQYEGGGGGAGGLKRGRTRLSQQIYPVTIGAGGAPAAQSTDGGNNGSQSSAFGISSTGGGRGGRFSSVAGAAGGSGGGGGGPSGGGGSGTSGEGSSGGNGASSAGGGGGGAGANGSNASSNTGGAGGSGSLVFDAYYAGGGGGGATTTIGAGGIGGGGSGANYIVGATSGTVNTGGGGGGIRENVGVTAGAGGSGIVIIRYPYDGN